MRKLDTVMWYITNVSTMSRALVTQFKSKLSEQTPTEILIVRHASILLNRGIPDASFQFFLVSGTSAWSYETNGSRFWATVDPNGVVSLDKIKDTTYKGLGIEDDIQQTEPVGQSQSVV